MPDCTGRRVRDCADDQSCVRASNRNTESADQSAAVCSILAVSGTPDDMENDRYRSVDERDTGRIWLVGHTAVYGGIG